MPRRRRALRAGLLALTLIVAAVLASLPGAAALPLVALPMYARITRDDLLASPARALVYGRLKGAPGSTIAGLAAATGLSRSTVAHHLFVLERAGLVRSERVGRDRIHFLCGQRDEGLRRRLLADPLRAALVARLQAAPAPLRELARALGESPSLVHFHLRRLREAGLVWSDPHSKCYSAGPRERRKV